MRVYFIKHILFLIMLIVSFEMHSQIATTNNPPFNNEEAVVTNVLLGQGIVANNFSSIGFQNGIGYFDGFNSNIGFDEGVILSTGGLEMVTNGFGIGSGVAGDPDLELALNAINLTWPVNNVTVLEFDFVAESETMAFNYVFGSTEYTSFTCSSYNDIFGFFLSGPGINGPYSNNAINLAYIPDPEGNVNYEDWLNNNNGLYTNTPVAVNTVNAGSPVYTDNPTCDAIDPDFESYNIFWIDNDYAGAGWDGPNTPPAPEFTVSGVTGFTTPLTAEYNDLICGETYHIKLAIADAADGALNSAVFLEANSFASPEVEISTVPNTELGLVLDVENGVLEGCGEVAIQFDRGGDLSMDLNVVLEYSGDATYGVDYQELPTEITLPAFQEQFILPITVFYDNIDEAQELLNITISGVPVACEEVTVQDIEIIILDQNELVVDVPSQFNINCTGSALIDATISGGYPPYNYTWFDDVGNIIASGELESEGIVSIDENPDETTNYSIVVTDDCLDQIIDESFVVVVEDEILSATLIEQDIIICEDDLSTISLEATVIGGVPDYSYTWFYEGVVISNAQVLDEVPGEGLFQLIVEEACGAIAADEVEITFIELSPYVEVVSNELINPQLIPEGCFQSYLQFTSQTDNIVDTFLEFEISGSASIDDFIISSNVTILAGEQVALVPISVISDNLDEGVEEIVFNFPFVDDCSGFPNQLTVQIYDPADLNVELGEDINLCEQDVAGGVIQGFYNGGLGNINYGWFYDGELISSNIDLPTINLQQGNYTFLATDECGNEVSEDIMFSITYLTPTVTITSNDFADPQELYEGCGSSTLTFEMPYPFPVDTTFYFDILSNGAFVNGIDIEQIENFVQVPAGDLTVDVELIPILDALSENTEYISFEFPFATNCSPQNSIDVQILNYDEIEIDVPEDLTLCTGQTLDLFAQTTGGFPPYTESWTYLSQSENSNIISIDVESGTNQAEYTVTDNCGYSQSAIVQVEGLDVDIFSVVWPPSQVNACYGDNSEINLMIEGGLPPYTFDWYLDNVNISAPDIGLPWNVNDWIPGSSQTIATSPPYTPFSYNYEVMITDSCQNEISYDIEVVIEECILPTAFTPNGDGNNDFFWVDFGDLSSPVSLEIFNRWGEVVYRSADYTPCADFMYDCWDGTHFQSFGDLCSEGTYYYIFTYSDPINNTDSYNLSNFTESIFGGPNSKNKGRVRTGSILMFH